jgi:hypothetical protein
LINSTIFKLTLISHSIQHLSNKLVDSGYCSLPVALSYNISPRSTLPISLAIWHVLYPLSRIFADPDLQLFSLLSTQLSFVILSQPVQPDSKIARHPDLRFCCSSPPFPTSFEYSLQNCFVAAALQVRSWCAPTVRLVLDPRSSQIIHIALSTSPTSDLSRFTSPDHRFSPNSNLLAYWYRASLS